MSIIIVRTLIVFISLLLSMRLMGKRQLGELELSELVVAVLISDVAAHPLQDIGIPIINGIVPVFVLLCCELIISGIATKSEKARTIMFGKPSILICDGIIDQKEIQKNRFTVDELTEELRKQSITDLSKVKYAILETDDTLNSMLYAAESPITPSQLELSVPESGKPIIIINNGRLMSENLTLCNKNENWLKKELEHRGIKSYDDIYLMSLDSLDQIYIAELERDI